MDGRVKMLREALTVLASDPDSQLKHLEETGAPECVDELALDYDTIAAASNDMLEKGEINKMQHDCATQLNDYLGRISGSENAQLWTPEALRSAEEWKRVRSMASECLELLKRSPSADRTT